MIAFHDPNRRRLPWWQVSLLLAAAGVGSLVVWNGNGASVADEEPSAPASRTAVPEWSVAPSPAPIDALVEPKPVGLVIGSIDVSTPLVELGLRPDLTVQVPRHPEWAGWFREGPRPGSPGSAVILGHVDSVLGPAVFYRLRYLQPGDTVDVARSDGSVARFVVTESITYSNDQFPAARVYSTHGRRALNLVTCGGAYDRDLGGYQANVVVYTRWVRTTPTPA